MTVSVTDYALLAALANQPMNGISEIDNPNHGVAESTSNHFSNFCTYYLPGVW